MIDILKHEQGKYEQIWDLPAYSDNSPGSKYADMFMQITGAQPKDSVIDLGCGAGAGGRALVEHKLLVTYLDFVQVPDVPEPFIQQSLWEPISAGTWKYGFCCDVMEHLPPEFSMLAVHNMLEACDGVFFSIAFAPDYFGRFVGEPLHLNVKPFVWWRDRLAGMGNLIEARDLLGEGVFYVTRA
jgi:hypothetical protein